jgi:hypothetical protein
MFKGFYLPYEFTFYFEDVFSLAVTQKAGKANLDSVVPVRAALGLADDEYFHTIIGGVSFRNAG